LSNPPDSSETSPTPGAPDADHTPYVPAAESPREFSMKAVAAGVAFGICFGAANAYLGLLIEEGSLRIGCVDPVEHHGHALAAQRGWLTGPPGTGHAGDGLARPRLGWG